MNLSTLKLRISSQQRTSQTLPLYCPTTLFIFLHLFKKQSLNTIPTTGMTIMNKMHNSEHDPCRNMAELALLNKGAGGASFQQIWRQYFDKIIVKTIRHQGKHMKARLETHKEKPKEVSYLMWSFLPWSMQQFLSLRPGVPSPWVMDRYHQWPFGIGLHSRR